MSAISGLGSNFALTNTAAANSINSLSTGSSLSTSSQNQDSDAVATFNKYVNMTPAQKFMEQMTGVTPDQYKAMSPAQQAKIQEEVREKAKAQMQHQDQNDQKGMVADVRV